MFGKITAETDPELTHSVEVCSVSSPFDVDIVSSLYCWSSAHSIF